MAHVEKRCCNPNMTESGSGKFTAIECTDAYSTRKGEQPVANVPPECVTFEGACPHAGR